MACVRHSLPTDTHPHTEPLATQSLSATHSSTHKIDACVGLMSVVIYVALLSSATGKYPWAAVSAL